MFKKLLKRYNDFKEYEKHQQEKERENNKFGRQLQGLGLEFSGIGEIYTDVGKAIEVAKQYGIEFYIGTCYSQCRAVLPKSSWKNQIDDNVCPFNYGTFIHKPVWAIDSISGFGSNVCHAVTRCLINARVAGVI